MKAIIVSMIVLASSVSALAVENKDLECTLTRYTTEIDSQGKKVNEQTIGHVRQRLEWSKATDMNTQDRRFEIDGIALSASLSSEKCWDDDRFVECNERMLFLSIYNRQTGGITSTHYNLNSVPAGTQMSMTYQSPQGYHTILCVQKY
ncbi:hypothetical protein [Pseudobdellovibrio exovorus]|uniref:Lipoprotein n=1 Tax=Pseudobdellovibrio exovorus JSS TaxID=1184267 RepID=M4V9W3_9BACT|nr:hypothetical protein [Pseudobdellovibrio exovorus]AGH94821.1 hypothetical protein A11Q_601 [Pseudobdellovibrio exovorus JSS]